MDAMLIRRFGEAGLDLRPALAPIEASNPEIFQMDIRRLGAREHFRVWPGRGTSPEVLSTDAGLRQLVLLVREPRRRFTQTLSRRGFLRTPGSRVVASTSSSVTVERLTSGKSRYLCGMDERHLFIARLNRGTTVKEAHASLRPSRLPSTALRQGEWFFVPLAPAEQARLETLIAGRRAVVLAKEPLGAGGHPHTADELLRLPLPSWAGSPGRAPAVAVFVRGTVRHAEHRTLRFRSWVSVLRNAEPGPQGQLRNILWID